MSKCRVTVTMIMYVPTGIPLPWVIRTISDMGGAVRSVNEEIRRVVARAGLGASRAIVASLLERGVPPGNLSMEVAAACRVSSWSPPEGFRAARGTSYRVYVGVCMGRIVMVELKGRVLLVKIGRPTKLKTPPSTLGPGDFVLNSLPDPEDIAEVVSCVLGGGGEKR